MKTVKDVSSATGVSIRRLRYYDSIGLLKPSALTEAGYRLYDEDALKRLHCVMLFRELGFSLREIAKIIDSPGFEKRKALEQQLRLLKLKRERIDNIISAVNEVIITEGENMDFSAFDSSMIDNETARAKAMWGHTDAYREFEEKSAGRTERESKAIADGLMDIFAHFGALRGMPADSKPVISLVERLRGYIAEHYYNCTPQILRSLAAMYAGGGSMTENIDRAGGSGTAELAAKAIEAYCGRVEA